MRYMRSSQEDVAGRPRTRRRASLFTLHRCVFDVGMREDLARELALASGLFREGAAPLRGVGRDLGRRRVCGFSRAVRLRRGPEVFAATSKLGPYQTKPFTPPTLPSRDTNGLSGEGYGPERRRGAFPMEPGGRNAYAFRDTGALWRRP